jgi:hypothetical protein
VKCRPEWRNVVLRRELVRRISVEYVEMPGLCLTVTQAQRLFCSRCDTTSVYGSSTSWSRPSISDVMRAALTSATAPCPERARGGGIVGVLVKR